MEKHELDGDRIFLLTDVLSPEECAAYIALSEQSPYEEAPLYLAEGPVLDKQVRDNARLVRDDPDLARELWRRAGPLVPLKRGSWQAIGLHPRFRFYRYDPGQKFAPHFDGYIEEPDGSTSSLTFLVYLNDGFEGGETRFYPFHLHQPIVVEPRRGTAVLFAHRQLHEGASVLQGRKYVLRSDVMYRRGAEDDCPEPA